MNIKEKIQMSCNFFLIFSYKDRKKENNFKRDNYNKYENKKNGWKNQNESKSFKYARKEKIDQVNSKDFPSFNER